MKPKVQLTKKGTYYWCKCGFSNQQPFCDGSHEGTGITPVKVDIEEDKSYAWCVCKETGTEPFCDGSHTLK